MWGTDMRPDAVRCSTKKQKGVSAVEFAVVAIVFFTFLFGVLELARAEYIFNVVREITRRGAAAAANVNFLDAGELQKVQAQAVFRVNAGPLPLGDPITADNVTIDYLSVSQPDMSMIHMTALPSSPAANRLNCLADLYASNCIRFVRVRVCGGTDAAGGCSRLTYQNLFLFFNLSGMQLPVAETIVPAGSLGYTVGSMP
jgi:hypothetical protein